MAHGLHRLTDINPLERRAVCAQCGPVNVKRKRRNGDVFWVCRPAWNERNRKWSGPWTAAQERLRIRLRSLQADRCGICKSLLEGPGQMDHCHESGEIRGLLCARCNLGISYFDGHPDWLAAALIYLAHPPARRVVD